MECHSGGVPSLHIGEERTTRGLHGLSVHWFRASTPFAHLCLPYVRLVIDKARRRGEDVTDAVLAVTSPASPLNEAMQTNAQRRKARRGPSTPNKPCSAWR